MNCNLTSCVIIHQFASTNAFIASLSVSAFLPKCGASSTLKLQDRNLENQFWQWRTFNIPSPYTMVNFFLVWAAKQ